jgi:hypothetical protein
MNIPCSTDSPCPADNGLVPNLSSEAPDVFQFTGQYYFFAQPPLGVEWELLFFTGYGQGTTPDAAATAAIPDGQEGVYGTWTQPGSGDPTQAVPPGTQEVPPGNPGVVTTNPGDPGFPSSRDGRTEFVLHGNTPQSCAINCPDGNPFVYTIAANIFHSGNQLAANEAAQTYACSLAKNHIVCLSDVPPTVCIGVFTSATIVATGRYATSPGSIWSVVGTLPPGMTFQGNTPALGQATISGVPTTAGSYTFAVEFIDPVGDTMVKTYTVAVSAFTGLPLPTATMGSPYSAQILAPQLSGAAIFISSGELPNGLSMDATGLITGTPTTVQTSSFSVSAISVTSPPVECETATSITVGGAAYCCNCGANVKIQGYTTGLFAYNQASAILFTNVQLGSWTFVAGQWTANMSITPGNIACVLAISGVWYYGTVIGNVITITPLGNFIDPGVYPCFQNYGALPNDVFVDLCLCPLGAISTFGTEWDGTFQLTDVFAEGNCCSWDVSIQNNHCAQMNGLGDPFIQLSVSGVAPNYTWTLTIQPVITFAGIGVYWEGTGTGPSPFTTYTQVNAGGFQCTGPATLTLEPN